MNVKILNECGYNEALTGLSLSYNVEDTSALAQIANKLAGKDGGHNKFLESMVVWIDIDAPRYWWSQFDTYRTGTSKQSESTMHTILKRQLVQEDFESPILRSTLEDLNFTIKLKNLDDIKNLLPEGFLQRRIVCTNYKVLRSIYKQRFTHKLPQWQTFCNTVLENVEFPEFIVKD